MISLVGSTIIGTSYESGVDIIPIPSRFSGWAIEHYHKSGGLKKAYEIEESSPLASFSFELNLKTCGSATIDFSYIDVPIDSEDIFKIYYGDELKYTGIVDVIPDPKGGAVTLIPVHERLSEILISLDYSSTPATYAEILEDVISAMPASAGIIFATARLKFTSTATLATTYTDVSAASVIDEVVGLLPGYFWGVDQYGFFYVQALDTVVSKNFVGADNPPFGQLSAELDYSKIEATRYQVYRVGAFGGETEYVNNVVSTRLEAIMRRKDARLEISSVMTDAEAVAYATAKLEAQKIPEVVRIQAVDLERWFPRQFALVRVSDSEEYQLATLDECEDNTAGYFEFARVSHEYSDDGIDGGNCLKLSNVNAFSKITWGKGYLLTFNGLQKIGFMAKANIAGAYMKVRIRSLTEGGADSPFSTGAFSSDPFSASGSSGFGEKEILLNIPNGGLWTFYSFDFEYPITEIVIEGTDSPPAGYELRIDRLQAYCITRREYESNVYSVAVSVDSDGETVNTNLNEYEYLATQSIADTEARVATLEAIQAAI